MTDFWQHNLDLLQKTLPAIYDWVSQYPERPAEPEHDKTEHDVEQWFQDLTQIEWYIGLLLGFGDGEHVERLIETYPDRGLYVLEPEPDAFLRACHDRDLEPIVAHVGFRLLLIHQPNARLIAYRTFQSIREGLDLGKIVTLNWPAYKKRHLEFWQEFHERITEHIKQDATNNATYRRYSLDWQRNVWDNLPYAITDPGAGCLFDQFEGKPAILVASGPSLEKNIHLLRDLHDRALIVAAGSGIEPLRKAGIRPHLVLSFDASEQNVQPFLDFDIPDLPLVYSGVIYPGVVRDYPGPRFNMVVDVYPFESWLYKQLGQSKGEMSSGPSVANVTWDLLMRLGCNPIILVGQDLALTGNRTHAEGVVAATVIDPEAEEGHYELVEGVDGEKVLTTMVMLTMKTWFEQRIIGWHNAQAQAGVTIQRTIDATEGGAKIDGTELMTLQEAAGMYCTEDFYPAQRIAELHAEHRPEPIEPAQVESMKERLRTALSQLTTFCSQGQAPIATLTAMSRNGVTGEEILPLVLKVAGLDRRISGHEVHRQFLEPAMRQFGQMYTIVSNQLRNETEPAQAAKLLVELYGHYFDDTQRMVAEIERMF